MAQLLRIVSALLAVASWHVVLGFQVAPGSPCAAICDVPASPEATGNSSEIVCGDDAIRSTSAGARMKACLTCLESSTHTNGSETDQQWLLYNLRVTLATCVFEVPPAEGEPEPTCNADFSCSPLRTALFFKGSEGENGGYEYCDASDDGFKSPNLQTCIGCLESNKNEVYLLNFMNVLAAACVYKPEPGSLLIRSGLFSTDGVEIVVPETENTSEPSAAPTTTTETTHKAGLTQVQTIAIIVSVAGTIALAAVLFTIYFLKRRRQNRLEAAFRAQQSERAPPTNPYPIMTEVQPQGKEEGASPSSYSTVSSFHSTWTFDPKVCSTATLSWTDVSGLNTTSYLPVHPAYVANIPGRKSHLPEESGNVV